ncbi:MAG: hypothetical protein ABSF21_00155 [Dehalococcoidia bacterium]|jgi:hypothetical protein
MKPSWIKVDEERVLSDGSKASVEHVGRMYFYSRLYLNPEENPMEHQGFTGKGSKNKAMKILEEALKNDVLEKEE